jgi:hypothetical protein
VNVGTHPAPTLVVTFGDLDKIKTPSFAHLLVTFFVAVPFVPGCDGGGAEDVTPPQQLAGSTCTGADCSASEPAASSDVPSALAEGPAELALEPPSAASQLEAVQGFESLESLESLSPVDSLGLADVPSAESVDRELPPAPRELPEANMAALPQWKAEKTDRFGNTFRLDQQGNLFRFFGKTLKCQVTNNVLDFKMNMHPADEAVAYLVRNEGNSNGVLYALMDSPVFGSAQCPKSVRVQALPRLTGNVSDQYKIVSNTKDWELGTTVSMMAINGIGDLVGWRGRAAVWVNVPTVKFADLSMNTCYGAKDMSFSSYVGFLLEKSTSTFKRVLQVKGRNTVAESKWDTRTFRSIQEFKDYYKVCTKGKDTYPPPPAPPKYLKKLVKCESSILGFQVCDAQIGTGYIEQVKLVQQHSILFPCRSTAPFATFGADSKSVWASDGCRGTFEVTYVPSYY